LAISSNNIEKITGLKALKNLKILSIGRNLIKKFDGIGQSASMAHACVVPSECLPARSPDT
jgi:Leucine-rich repeat (LRR) protein